MQPFSLRTLLVAVFAINGGFAFGQALDRGEVAGTVTDQSGGVLPGVEVNVSEVNTGQRRTVVTGDSGQYRVVLLPVGTYVVEARLSGFQTYQSAQTAIRIGRLITVNITMSVAGGAEVVEVVAAGSTRAGVGALLEEDYIVDLPINGRDYRDFSQLSATAQTIRGTRGVFRLGGQPGDYTQLNVDGADFTNNFFGEFFGSLEITGFTVPQEGIQEFQVNSGGFGTEFGRSNGGMVNVVTKSGTNDYHGSGAYFYRDSSLSADDAFGNPPLDLTRNQWGGSLGGPIVKDRTFFFVAADFQRQTTPVVVKFNQDVSGVAVPEFGIASLSDLEGIFSRDRDISTVLGKIDHSFTDNQRFTTRVNYTRNTGTNQAGGPSITNRSITSMENFKNQGTSVVTSLTSVFGPNTVMESKFQFSREVRPRSPVTKSGPETNITGVGRFGKASFLPTTQDMNRYQGSITLTHTRGRHDISFGGDFNGFNMRNNFFAFANGGAYTFPSLTAFKERNLGFSFAPVSPGAPPSFGFTSILQSFGVGKSLEAAHLLDSFWQKEASFFVQDKFQVNSSLSLTLGLRYDAQLNPQPAFPTAGQMVPVGKPSNTSINFVPVPQDIPDDTNNWAGRFGLAWDIRGNGESVFRVGTGLYYGRTPIIYFPVRGSGVNQAIIFFFAPGQFGQFPNLAYPGVFPSQIDPGSQLESSLPTPSIQYVDPDFQNPRVYNLNLTFEQRVQDVEFEFTYLLSDSRNLRIGGFRSTLWDRNVFLPTEFDEFGRGINLLANGRPDPSIGRAEALGSFGRGRYQAAIVSVTKALSDGFQFFANYTLSYNNGNASTERDTEAFLGPSDPFNLDSDYGRNELDVRHAYKAGFLFDLPYGMSVSSTFRSDSGLSYPAYNATDANGDAIINNGLNPDRPVSGGRLLPRFPFHQPSNFLWDLRYTAGVEVDEGTKVSFIVEIFNLLNTDNVFADTGQGAIFGSPNFRVSNRILGTPFLLQLGARLDF